MVDVSPPPAKIRPVVGTEFARQLDFTEARRRREEEEKKHAELGAEFEPFITEFQSRLKTPMLRNSINFKQFSQLMKATIENLKVTSPIITEFGDFCTTKDADQLICEFLLLSMTRVCEVSMQFCMAAGRRLVLPKDIDYALVVLGKLVM